MWATRQPGLTDGEPPEPRIPADRGLFATARLVGSAWSNSGMAMRAAVPLTAIVALLATRSRDVPLASGLAVALLVAAALVDVDVRRLPDAIVLASSIAFAATLAVEAVRGTPVRAHHLALGGASMGGPLLVLHLVDPYAMGFGDVKVALLLGAAVGVVDARLALSALALAAGGTAVVGLVAGVRTLAFGPGLVVAGTAALAAHDSLLSGVPR